MYIYIYNWGKCIYSAYSVTIYPANTRTDFELY